MNNDTISRQAAVDAVIKLVQEAECRYPKHMAIPEFVYQGVVSIRELPSAERHGRWKPFDLTWGRSVYACTSCGEAMEVPTECGKPMYEFCPYCGAKMEATK